MNDELVMASQTGARVLGLSIANRREACEPARVAVVGFLAANHASAGVIFKVELILEEMLMNLIWHAFGDGEEHRVSLRIELVGSDIVMQFEDDGVAFDPTLAAEPATPATIGEATPGGLGLALVRKFSGGVAYSRINARNRTVVRLALA